MVNIVATDQSGSEHLIEGEAGLSLMRNLKDIGGLDLPAICGGIRSCGTCHVLVHPDWYRKLAKPTVDEIELIENEISYQAGSSRLRCQIDMNVSLDGIRVTLASSD